jgi:hypothetical protein
MADAKVAGVVFDLLEPAIGTFPNLVTPKQMKVRGVPKGEAFYSLEVEIDAASPELQRLRSCISEAARERFPSLNLGEAIKNNTFNVPLKNGDVLAAAKADSDKKREWSRGKWVLTCRSDFAPALVIVQGGKAVEITDPTARKAAEREHFYSGQRVLVGVRLKAYDGVNDGKPGVKAYLEAVRSCGGGEKLFGAPDATERFKGYAGNDTTEDPTGASTSGDW